MSLKLTINKTITKIVADKQFFYVSFMEKKALT